METRQADRIAAALEEMVLTGQFQDGDRLDEARLARKFGVSRTPVRDALQQLVAVELALQMPRRGVFVRHPNSIVLIEMFETMAEVEAVCSRLVAQRASGEALSTLRAVNQLCESAINEGDAALYSRHNEEFHRLIYRLTGNAFLENEAVRLYLRLRPFRRVQFRNTERMHESVTEHLQLLDAFEQRAEETAAQLARAHIATQGERFYQQIARMKTGPEIRRAS